MASVAERTPDNQTSLGEIVAVLEAVGAAVQPWARAYVALNRELSRSPLVRFLILLQTGQLLPPPAQAEAANDAVADPDAWYRECVEYAWGRRR